MSNTPYRALPVDSFGTPSQGSPPAVLALQRFSDENASTSSVVTLNDNTTVVELSATLIPAVYRWVASSDTQGSVISAEGTANYDGIIPADTVRRLPIPIERAGTASIVGLGVQSGLYRRIAWKSVGVGSVLSVEY